MDEKQVDDLVRRCQEAKEQSYSPYSKFRVGAALLCQDGRIYTEMANSGSYLTEPNSGCNVENVSYGLTICAERTALVKAVSEGHRKFKAIAIASDLANETISPCGACRQFLVEFGVSWDVIMTKPDMTYKTMKTGELLPLCVVSESLEEEKVSKLA